MIEQTSSGSGVLVADHNAHMTSIIGQMLRSLGRKDIVEVQNAPRAMAALNSRNFQILIIDDALEGMDGVAFTRQLRSNPDGANHDIAIIMISSAPDARRIAAARDAGITEFLRKPFAANHLQTRIANIEANPRGFIQAAAYTGPDRRRRIVNVGEKDRRQTPLGGQAG